MLCSLLLIIYILLHFFWINFQCTRQRKGKILYKRIPYFSIYSFFTLTHYVYIQFSLELEKKGGEKFVLLRNLIREFWNAKRKKGKKKNRGKGEQRKEGKMDSWRGKQKRRDQRWRFRGIMAEKNRRHTWPAYTSTL